MPIIQELVAAGPEGIESVVRRLLSSEAGGPVAAVEPTQASVLPTFGPTTVAFATPSPLPARDDIVCNPHPNPSQPASLSRLSPLGSRDAYSGAGNCAGGSGGCGPLPDDGIFWVAGSGIGVGAHAAGAPATAWRHVGAVVNLGALQHPGCASPGCWQVGPGGAGRQVSPQSRIRSPQSVMRQCV